MLHPVEQAPPSGPLAPAAGLLWLTVCESSWPNATGSEDPPGRPLGLLTVELVSAWVMDEVCVRLPAWLRLWRCSAGAAFNGAYVTCGRRGSSGSDQHVINLQEEAVRGEAAGLGQGPLSQRTGSREEMKAGGLVGGEGEVGGCGAPQDLPGVLNAGKEGLRALWGLLGGPEE